MNFFKLKKHKTQLKTTQNNSFAIIEFQNSKPKVPFAVKTIFFWQVLSEKNHIFHEFKIP